MTVPQYEGISEAPESALTFAPANSQAPNDGALYSLGASVSLSDMRPRNIYENPNCCPPLCCFVRVGLTSIF